MSTKSPIWITEVPKTAPAGDATLPLHGMTFAIKDNIDLAGVPTTAACPAYAFTPGESAAVVQRLVDAGAVPLGKTNMDQFATGLVGTRTPHEKLNCTKGALVSAGQHIATLRQEVSA